MIVGLQSENILKHFMKKRRMLLSIFQNSPKQQHHRMPKCKKSAHFECQNALLCLKFSCDKTTAALKLQNDRHDDTIEFLAILVKLFKIADVKGQFEKVHTKDETRAVLSSPDDERLNFLLSLANIVEAMSCERHGVRVK